MTSALVLFVGVASALAVAAVVAVGGYLASMKAAAKTAESSEMNTLHQLDSAHDLALRQQQAPTYRDAIAALTNRRDRRAQALFPFRWDKDAESIVDSRVADCNPPGWYEAQGNLALYASDDVLEANEAANAAHDAVLRLISRRAELVVLLSQSDPADPAVRDARTAAGAKHAALYVEAQRALHDAAAADEVVIKLMRQGVHAKPSQTLETMDPSRH